MNLIFFFLPFESPTVIILVLGVIVLLFGGSKLPQLAKALGQSKREFKKGMGDADDDEDDRPSKRLSGEGPAALSGVSDEQLFEEARRRAQELKR